MKKAVGLSYNNICQLSNPTRLRRNDYLKKYLFCSFKTQLNLSLFLNHLAVSVIHKERNTLRAANREMFLSGDLQHQVFHEKPQRVNRSLQLRVCSFTLPSFQISAKRSVHFIFIQPKYNTIQECVQELQVAKGAQRKPEGL